MSLLFIFAGLLAVAGALGVILSKQPVHQVLATVLNFVGLAMLYMSLQSEFMALVQMIVYSGAVMVLFLFVIALLTTRKDPIEQDHGKLTGQWVAGLSVGGAIMAMLVVVGLFGKEAAPGFTTTLAEGYGTVKAFGWHLLTEAVLPFELLAFILMVAVIGVVLLVGRQKA